MEELIRKMVRDLRILVVGNVPDEGDFNLVYTDCENPDRGYSVTHWMLKVTHPPKEIEETQRKRYLELVAYNLPSPYIAEVVLSFGDKQTILDTLQNEDTLITKIQDKMPDLARDLNDI